MMHYKYQLIILNPSKRNSLEEKIIQNLNTKLNDLSLNEEFIKIITTDTFNKEYKKNEPAFVLYLGKDYLDSSCDQILNILVENGSMILPIYKDSFALEIPKKLSNQNGFKCETESLFEIERIVNTALESFELLRTTRKVFISYKRNESSSVAIQLYEALEENNFDAFLDTHSIKPGDPFQDELWHRMTDCDLIILLNTPNFFESHWCKEEFAEAGAKQIGIVQLLWPDTKKEATTDISFQIRLSKDDFDGENTKHLSERTIKQILQQAESIRARNLASRQNNLITEFQKVSANHDRNITVQPERYLTENIDNKLFIYIPTIGIPQSINCQAADSQVESIKETMAEYKGKDIYINLIYDDLRIRDKWLNHLQWLNDNFKKNIRTLKKQEFESWFTKK